MSQKGNLKSKILQEKKETKSLSVSDLGSEFFQ